MKSSNPTVLRVFITLYSFVTMVLAFLIGFLAQVACVVLLWPFLLMWPMFRTKVLGAAFHWACGGALFVNPFWRVKVVRPVARGYAPTKTIVMSNHLAATDPWVMSYVLWGWEFKYIYKADLRKLPVAGWSLAMSGDLPVYFTKEKGGWATKPGSVKAMMEECKRLLAGGVGQMVFPEGTRSRHGHLQAFKDGFFRLAVEEGAEILPVVQFGGQQGWPVGEKLLDTTTIYIAFGDAIPTAGKTVEQLKEELRAVFLELLKLCPGYDPSIETKKPELAATRGDVGL